MCVSPLPGPFVLVMGSKNNNGKLDFKAAGPRWTAFRKERVLQGYHMTLTWMVSELWRGGNKASTVCNHLSRGQQGLFVWRSNHCDIWYHLISIYFLFLQFYILISPDADTGNPIWFTLNVTKPYIGYSFMWTFFLLDSNCNTLAALSHSCRSRRNP